MASCGPRGPEFAALPALGQHSFQIERQIVAAVRSCHCRDRLGADSFTFSTLGKPCAAFVVYRSERLFQPPQVLSKFSLVEMVYDRAPLHRVLMYLDDRPG